MLKDFNEGFEHLSKFLISAVPILGLYVAVKVKYGKVKFLSALVSGIIGVVFAWMFEGVVRHYFDDMWYTPIIGLLAITGRDICFWAIFKLNINLMLDKIQDAVWEGLKKKIGGLFK